MSVRDVVQAAAGALGGEALYAEDVFSTYLYTGNGSTQTITNGIDLSGEGGLVWIKDRNDTYGHYLFDTERGQGRALSSNSTSQAYAPSVTQPRDLYQFNSNGFSVATPYNSYVNQSAINYASWTFRKAPKWFDVVTLTQSNPVTNTTVNHNLGSVPGCIIVKCTSTAEDWYVYHRSASSGNYLVLNSTAAQASSPSLFTNITDTSFSYGNFGASRSYVFYLFAHNAGGFGADGTEDVISCGSYVEPNNGSFVDVNLGYEPQWLLVKCIDQAATSWNVIDNMRGMVLGSGTKYLEPNTSNAESSGFANAYFQPTATGFTAGNTFVGGGGKTIIYIAIRRPMKTPTAGTEVFAPVARTGNGTSSSSTAGFPVDLGLTANRGAIAWKFAVADRLRGATFLRTAGTNAEGNPNTEYTASSFASNTQLTLNGASDIVNQSSNTYIDLMFKRAPSFFDVVAYTGTDSSQTLNHNLGVAPEMIIVKRRNGGGSESWVVQHSGLTGGIGQGANSDYIVYLNSANAEFDSEGTFNFSPTSTTFSLQNNSNDQVNDLSGTYIAYLFATLAGVSKVGSYTGTGASDQTIDCGFSNGARFVMIKRTDSTSNWRVWDTARGIVAGNDNSLDLNSTSAEQTSFDQIDPHSSGFTVQANDFWNTSGANFIYLAIA